MGAVAYTSTLADADYYDSEHEREMRHIEQVPKLEREEVKQIYSQKGFHGELLEHIVETITANPDVWVAVMMSEEHQLSPVDRKQALKVASDRGFFRDYWIFDPPGAIYFPTSRPKHVGICVCNCHRAICCRCI